MRFSAPVGINFRTDPPITIPSLKRSLEAIAEFLKSRDQDGFLLRFDDWWQHDGEHMPKGKLSWEAFGDRFETEAAIAASMPKRDEVRVGICGPGMEWYLRYLADPANGSASLDLTVPAEWEEDLREVLDGLAPVQWERATSEDYYRMIRTGATPVTSGRSASRAARTLPDERFDALADNIDFGGGFSRIFQGKVVVGIVGALALLLAYLWLSELLGRLR